MASNPNLESLLIRIRDGVATADEFVRARQLVEVDSRLPEELREVVDFEDAQADAVGLLAVLGHDSLFGEVLREGLEAELQPTKEPVVITPDMLDGEWELGAVFAEAVRYEAGSVELADSVVAEVGGASRIELGAAIQAWAGEVDVVGSVLARCGLATAELPIAAAITREAGAVDLVSQIESELTDLALPLAEAIAFEAGTVELSDAVLAAVGGEQGLPIAEAVRAEAGTVNMWPELEAVVSDVWVSAMLDHELSPVAHRAAVLRLRDEPEMGATMTAFASLGSDVRAAVADEAGETPYIWAAVAEGIGVEAELVQGWDGEQFAAAIREEGGSVDLVSGVMAKVVTPQLPYAAVEIEAIPASANNRRWSLSTLVMAAAAALLIAVLPMGMQETQSGGAAVVPVESHAEFAAAGEIVVESLHYHEQASVTQTLGDEGALIIWVDEETTL